MPPPVQAGTVLSRVACADFSLFLNLEERLAFTSGECLTLGRSGPCCVVWSRSEVMMEPDRAVRPRPHPGFFPLPACLTVALPAGRGPSSMFLCSLDFWWQSLGPQAYRTCPTRGTSQPWTLTPPRTNRGEASLWSRCPFPPGLVGLEDQARRGLWRRFPCRAAVVRHCSC